MRYLWVGLAGAVGSMPRYAIGPSVDQSRFPLQDGVDLHNRRCDGARLAMRVGIGAAERAGTMVSSWVVSRVSGADAGPTRSGALPGWSAGRRNTPSRPTPSCLVGWLDDASVADGNLLPNTKSAPRRARR